MNSDISVSRNKELYQLYEQNRSKLFELQTEKESSLSGPFLIAPNDNYWNSSVKIAFVGQETKGWKSYDQISDQMHQHEKFNLGENYFSSPFWNVIRKIEKELTGNSLCSAWLNLNRYCENKKRPKQNTRIVLERLDQILQEELKLISPDVIIFFTGPFYDRRVKKIISEDVKNVEGFRSRELCKYENSPLANLIYRTYHPNYLRRSGIEKRIIQTLEKEISSQ